MQDLAKVLEKTENVHMNLDDDTNNPEDNNIKFGD